MYFGMQFCAPNCHTFCGNQARSGDGGQNASKNDVRNPTFVASVFDARRRCALASHPGCLFNARSLWRSRMSEFVEPLDAD
jgi:hypothetical protein